MYRQVEIEMCLILGVGVGAGCLQQVQCTAGCGSAGHCSLDTCGNSLQEKRIQISKKAQGQEENGQPAFCTG